MGPDEHVTREPSHGSTADLGDETAVVGSADLADEIRRTSEVDAVIAGLDSILERARAEGRSDIKLLTLDTCAHGEPEHMPGLRGVLRRLVNVIDFEPIAPSSREHMNCAAYEKLWDHLTERGIRFAFQNANRNFENAVSLDPGFEVYVEVTPAEERE